MVIHHHDNVWLCGGDVEVPHPLIIIILNFTFSTEMLKRIWSKADYIICADGGANRLYDSRLDKIPHLILGDGDSIRNEVLTHYQHHGTTISFDPSNQDTNDLEKCLYWTSIQYEPAQTNLVIFGALGGRYDQEMQNINSLYQWQNFQRLVLLSKYTLVHLLVAGKHEIRPNFNIEERTCGIIPVGGKCKRITTTGLKWNLQDASLSFGHVISSSNHVEGDVVCIDTSDPVLWTTALRQSADQSTT